MTLVNHETGEILETLTGDEITRLRVKEHAIERGADEVAKALTAIRDERLYRADFSTFESYCRERWGMSRSRAYQHIAAVEVNEIVSTIVDTGIPESQARELADLRDDPDALRETYQKAHEATAGNVTAAAIRAVRTPEPEPIILAPNETVNVETGEIVERQPLAPIPPTPTPKPERSGEQQNAEENSRTLASTLIFLLAFQHPTQRDTARIEWAVGSNAVPPTNRDYVTPDRMRQAAEGLVLLADEWESTHE